MLTAQEVVVTQETDPLTLIISGSAVLIALGSLVWTYINGKALRNIEAREHEWQHEARKSAWIQVVRGYETQDIGVPGRESLVTFTERWLRLTNTGLASAKNVRWELTGGDNLPHIEVHQTPVLHPGESYDVYYSLTLGTPPGWGLRVHWEDGNGARSNHRMIEPAHGPGEAP